jgi:predicted N-acetyltransferase YhbS
VSEANLVSRVRDEGAVCASYYPRFGFERADIWSIRGTFDAPTEAFMITWTTTPVNGPGLARYHPAFDEV